MKETAYLLQATLISAWWVGLFSSHTFFSAFQFDKIPPTAFWSFFVPDIVLIASLSTIRAYKDSTSLELIVLGAFSYAALYCVNATILTGSGLLPTGLMLLGLAYNIFLCFNPSLFRASSSKSIVINTTKTLIQILCIWFLALVVIPFVLLESFGGIVLPRAGGMLWSSVALFVVFSMLGLCSSYFMVRDGCGTPLPLDQTNELVVSGPYRFVRNPMAIAGIGQGLQPLPQTSTNTVGVAAGCLLPILQCFNQRKQFVVKFVKLPLSLQKSANDCFGRPDDFVSWQLQWNFCREPLP